MDHPRGSARDATHGGTGHARAYTHRARRPQGDHRRGGAAARHRRVRRARDRQHARRRCASCFSRYPDRAALRTCYEAGPTGYDTWRLLSGLGVPCEVIAPSLIPRRSGAHVKTDRIDARNLARLHRAGELTAVRVPTPAEEALRDLVRAREDLKSDRRVARQRIRRASCSATAGATRRRAAAGACASRSGCRRSPSRSPPPRPPSTTSSARLLRARTRSSRRSSARSRRRRSAGRSPSRWRACAPSAASTRSSAVTILTETCDFRRFPTAASYIAGPQHRHGDGLLVDVEPDVCKLLHGRSLRVWRLRAEPRG